MKLSSVIRHLLLAFLAFSVSCSEPIRTYGNGNGVFGEKVIATYDTAGVHCNARNLSPLLFNLDCVLVRRDADTERVATEIDSNLSLTWNAPEKTESNHIKNASCTVADNNLSQTCQVELDSAILTDITSTLALTNNKTQETRTESADVPLDPTAGMGGGAGLVTYTPASCSASATWAGHPCENLWDGTAADWNAGIFPPTWVETDLGAPKTIQRIDYTIGLLPDGVNEISIYGGPTTNPTNLIAYYNESMTEGEKLIWTGSVSNVRYLRYVITSSASWTSIHEITVYGP